MFSALQNILSPSSLFSFSINIIKICLNFFELYCIQTNLKRDFISRVAVALLSDLLLYKIVRFS